jgi:predicted nucleotidyltransferase
MADHTPRVVEQFLERTDALFGTDYCAVLYGSVARGDYVEGRSDVNLLVVTPRLAPAELRGLSGALREFERQRFAPPLLITATEWARAADVFPIEITDMKLAYRVLKGVDPVAAQSVRPGDLRRALEAELRGKLLRLRVHFGLYADDQEALATVVGHSAGSIRVLLRCMLALAGRPVPLEDRAMAAAAGALCACSAAALEQLLGHRRHIAWKCPPELFEAYIGVVEQATHFVDHAHPGAH